MTAVWEDWIEFWAADAASCMHRGKMLSARAALNNLVAVARNTADVRWEHDALTRRLLDFSGRPRADIVTAMQPLIAAIHAAGPSQEARALLPD
ncbi:hypothetical protein [Salinarimonas rosea]|uniref:hypothetical protein n=1 Tax=Salinarimonas rosea TaxID=552063 RepID=UPI00048D87B9|nr:hypothetical protein [Salinarimonas rosea]